MSTENISSDCPYPSKYVECFGSKIHYLEHGTGDPILFLHGIPASSYVWRNIIPHLAPLGRCIAPDLIGLGKSDKPKIAYAIQDHIKYIDQFIATLNLQKITLVLHAWGSIIGFDYAMRHQNNCKGLVFYEAYLRPLNGEDLSLPYQEQVFTLQDLATSNDIINHGVSFVDQLLQQEMLRPFSNKEMARYREPFTTEGSGQPLLQYLKELCATEGGIHDIIKHYSAALTQSKIPKLLLYAMPGFITTIATILWAKEHLPNLEIIDIGEATHYAQESNPALMGESISVWMQGIEQQI